MDPAPVTDRSSADLTGCPVSHATPVAPPAGQCPVPHGNTAPAETEEGATCPVMHGAGAGQRSKADLVVRRILRVPDSPPGATTATAYRGFQRSMLVSATRCTLTYIVFPFLLPLIHVLEGGAPIIGVLVGSVALVSDTFTIRRFFAIDHKWRWYFSGLAFAVMCLLIVLLVEDFVDLANHFG